MRKLISKKFPAGYKFFKSFYFFLVRILTGKNENEQIFEKIYKQNFWNDSQSLSGYGSNIENTRSIRSNLPLVIKEFNIKTILDIPCGDFFWMNTVDLSNILYTGADIVDELIKKNNLNFGSSKKKFLKLDIINDNLPEADLILCRDCLPHLSYKNIFSAIKQIQKSKSKYILTSTYVEQEMNRDISTGSFRRINLELPPFSFPLPLKLIDDKCSSEIEVLEDKKLGLWKISDIP